MHPGTSGSLLGAVGADFADDCEVPRRALPEARLDFGAHHDSCIATAKKNLNGRCTATQKSTGREDSPGTSSAAAAAGGVTTAGAGGAATVVEGATGSAAEEDTGAGGGGGATVSATATAFSASSWVVAKENEMPLPASGGTIAYA